MFPHRNDRPPTGSVLKEAGEGIVPLSGTIPSVAYSSSIQAIIGRSLAPTTSIGWWVPSSAHLV